MKKVIKSILVCSVIALVVGVVAQNQTNKTHAGLSELGTNSKTLIASKPTGRSGDEL